MKALVLKEYTVLSYEDVPDPQPGPGEVLIQVKACGICGSDVHGMDGSTGRRVPPGIMGHEASGVIVAVGDGVTLWHEGDRVTFDSTVYCGTCHFCLRGEINLCDNRRVLGVSCGEYRRHGAFAEFVAVPQHILYRLPDNVSFEHAAMVESMSIAFHAIRRVPVTLNDTAVVVGSGMIGLMAIQLLRIAGCGRIIAVDLDDRRLTLAVELGADERLRPGSTDLAAQILERTGGRGADAAFEAVGIDRTVRLAVACVRKGGAVGLIGNVTPEVTLPLQAVVTRELTLYGSCASRGEYPACLDMIGRGRMRLDKLLSATAPLSEGARWFERLYAGDSGLMKVVLVP